MVSDRMLGWSLVGLSSAFIVFYTVWVVLLPFVDKEQAIHQYFPDRFYAVAFPLLSGVIGLLLIGGFVLYSLKTSANYKIGQEDKCS